MFFILLLISFPLTIWAQNLEQFQEDIFPVITDQEASIIENLAFSPEWLKYMQYTSQWGGGYKGRADGRGFYFSKNGKFDPKSELIESLLALKQNRKNLGFLKKSFPCALPARTEFLQKHFHLKIKEEKCEDFEDFFNGMNPHGLSIIFASNYAQSSVSYFGHTFLRINNSPQGNQNQQDILDYSFGFSAAVGPDDSTLKVGINALYGNIQGIFDIRPYYLKIKEYNHMEARDLWEYRLNISEEESRFFVKYLWELGSNTYFDYYFLDENCSYFILALLEGVKPEWNLLQDFPIYVIPGETIKSLKKVGAIKEVSLRPSIRRKMHQRELALSDEQILEFKKIVDGSKLAMDEDDPLVLEMVLSYYSFHKFSQNMNLPKESENIFAQSLTRQSQLPTVDESVFPPIIVNSRPDESHHTFNLGGSFGLAQGSGSKQKTEVFTEFSFKPAVHDLLNRDTGFNPNSQTDYLRFKFRYYYAQKRMDLDELMLVGMMTLIPQTQIDKGLSWGVHFGLTTPKDYCYKCKAGYFEFQLGGSWNFLNDRLSLYTLPLIFAQGSLSFKQKLRGGPGLNLGLLANPFDQYKLQIQTKAFSDLFQSSRQKAFLHFEINQSYAFSQKYEARFYLSHYQKTSTLGRNYQEAKLNFNYYY